MKKKFFKAYYIIYIVVFYVLYLLIYSTFFFKDEIIGSYYSNNKNSVLEGPSRYGEILKLKKDGTFESDTWGEGTYKIYSDGIFSRRIQFHYEYMYGSASYKTTIKTNILGRNPKIVLDYDLDFYFLKK